MAFDAHKNFALSVVQTAPSPPASGTSLTLRTGDGALFPAVPFNATVWPASAVPTIDNAEIVRVTARASDVLTITRAQESTLARLIGAGDTVAATITAKTITDVETATVPLTGTWTPAIAFGGAAVGATYSVQNGTYVKVGPLVYIAMDLAITSNGSSTGAATVTGLPFANNTIIQGGVFSPWNNALAGVSGGVLGLINASQSSIILFTQGATGATSLTDTNLPDNCRFVLVGAYRSAIA